jgi:hypothetical protein
MVMSLIIVGSVLGLVLWASARNATIGRFVENHSMITVVAMIFAVCMLAFFGGRYCNRTAFQLPDAAFSHAGVRYVHTTGVCLWLREF